jgi:7-keto-8-aminopelargonate synthetase-like enzyme
MVFRGKRRRAGQKASRPELAPAGPPACRPAGLPASSPAEPLQQVDRTYVLQRGRKLSYFGGCDYFRLASHPEVLRAVREGLERFGLNVAASRKTTGHHPLYAELEEEVARFFGVDSAVLFSNGCMTNFAAAQTLAGEFTHALIDERAHASLFDAARLLDCPVRTFKHRDASSAVRAARRAGGTAKWILLTDGLFSHSGEVAPLDEYLRVLPASTLFLVDDAHGAGTLGRTGCGTVEHLGIPNRRLIQAITLSKAFGVYGGAMIGSRSLRRKIIARSRLFAGNTPLPLPLAAAALTSLNILRSDPKLRRRLVFNASYVKAALRETGLAINSGPGPIVSIVPRNRQAAAVLQQQLLAAGIHPPFIHYPGGPSDGYFRFAISSEHTAEQLDAMVGVLTNASLQQRLSSL